MRPALLDVNLLIALAWPSHVHHEPAHRWFAGNERFGWATCPLTQLAFVRLSSNSRIIEDAVLPQEALAVMKRIILLPHHVFWTDDLDPSALADGPFARIGSHRQVTDAYLLALAAARQGRLATLDRGMAALVPSDWKAEEVLTVIE
ncbi:MAG: VapC toxin family PIN domain ribonuclease [Kiritimatiellae bacterium]|nr:VapC toxin family PIN domain ribonuclease [Kiritimatiellia bacterium]